MASKKEAIQVLMMTSLACRFVHRDRARRGYRIAINLKLDKKIRNKINIYNTPKYQLTFDERNCVLYFVNSNFFFIKNFPKTIRQTHVS